MSAANRDLNAGELLNVVAGTTTQTTADMANADARGVKVFVNVSANAGGLGSITASIQIKDPGSGTYATPLSSAAIVATGFTVLTIYPGLAATANVTANDCLPRQWRIQVVANNANPVSYTVGACLLV